VEILNGSRENDLEGEVTFIPKAGGSVIDCMLCTYNTGRCLRTSEVRDIVISDPNIIETVIEI
jgi:hypothetical protein